uniref:Uncharacterized protein n=1 Tax=Ascaris lumbricoides TaxID=6252 RepID=A0A9J2P716_ASCLU
MENSYFRQNFILSISCSVSAAISNTFENEKVNDGSVPQMLVASALILLQTLYFQVHCLMCYEGVNCAMECDQCEGAACIKILR